MLFRDRSDAGRQLGERLAFLQPAPDVIVLGIPRGGVVVAGEVARALNAPLDVLIAHKIGAPFNSELAIGAVTSSGEVWLDEDLIGMIGVSRPEIEREVAHQREEITRRAAVFRKDRAPLDVANRTVLVVDDGIATGATMLVALRALRQQKPGRLILAVPVGPPDTCKRLARECDDLVTLDMPDPFWAVGRFYVHFGQTEDEEVVTILQEAASRLAEKM